MGTPDSRVAHSSGALARETLGLALWETGLGTPGRLRGHSGVGPFRRLWGWDCRVGHSKGDFRETLGLGNSGTLWIGHPDSLGLGTLRETLGLGTAGTLGLGTYSRDTFGAGHSIDRARRRVPTEGGEKRLKLVRWPRSKIAMIRNVSPMTTLKRKSQSRGVHREEVAVKASLVGHQRDAVRQCHGKIS